MKLLHLCVALLIAATSSISFAATLQSAVYYNTSVEIPGFVSFDVLLFEAQFSTEILVNGQPLTSLPYNVASCANSAMGCETEPAGVTTVMGKYKLRCGSTEIPVQPLIPSKEPLSSYLGVLASALTQQPSNVSFPLVPGLISFAVIPGMNYESNNGGQYEEPMPTPGPSGSFEPWSSSSPNPYYSYPPDEPSSFPSYAPYPSGGGDFPTYSYAPYPSGEAPSYSYAPYPSGEVPSYSYVPYPSGGYSYAPYPSGQYSYAPYPSGSSSYAPYPSGEFPTYSYNPYPSGSSYPSYDPYPSGSSYPTYSYAPYPSGSAEYPTYSYAPYPSGDIPSYSYSPMPSGSWPTESYGPMPSGAWPTESYGPMPSGAWPSVDPTYAPAYPTSDWDSFEPTANFGQCVLEFVPDETGHTLTDINGTPLSWPSGVYFTPAEPVCDYQQLSLTADRFSASLYNMSQTSSYAEIEMSMFEIAAYLSSKAFISCSSLVESMVVVEPSYLTVYTTQCVYEYGTLDWSIDPCCNYSLRYDQCCVASPVQVPTSAMVGVNADIIQACRNPIAITSFLETVLSLYSTAGSCDAAYGQVLTGTSNVFNKTSQFIQDCYNTVFNTTQTCTSNAACYSGICSQGLCIPPWYNPGNALYKCFVDKIDPDLQNYLKMSWGLNSDDEFPEAFKQHVFDQGCAGPTAHQFEPRWTYSYDSETGSVESVWSPGNLTACLAQVDCNWASCSSLGACSFNEETFEHTCDYTLCESLCLNPQQTTPQSFGGSYYHSGEHNFIPEAPPAQFCAYSYSGSGAKVGQLMSMTKPGMCSLNTHDSTECTDAGGHFDYFTETCTINNVDNITACINPLACLAENSTYSFGSALSQTTYCTNLCLNTVPRNATECEALNTAAGDSEEHDWCWWCPRYEWVDGVGCKYSGGTSSGACQWDSPDNVFYPGGTYVQAEYTTEAQCDAGYCALQPGLDQAQCEALGQCHGNCAKCEAAYTMYSPICLATINQTDCDTYSGSMVVYGNNTVCQITTSAVSTCANIQNSVLLSADNCTLLTPTECQACQANDPSSCPASLLPYLSTLQCSLNTWGQCSDQDQCLAGGTCNDWEFTTYNPVTFKSTPGACVMPAASYSYGWPQCAAGQTSTSSGLCIEYSVYNDSACASAGGQWQYRALTEGQCNAHGYGCKEPGMYGLTPKSPEYCTACGGLPTPYYAWTANEWASDYSFWDLAWTTREMVPVNQMGIVFNSTAMSEAVANATASMITNDLQSLYMCKYNPVLYVLGKVSCDCGLNGEDTCFDADATTIATASVFPGSSAVINNPSVSLSAGATALNVTSFNMNVSVGLVLAVGHSVVVTGTSGSSAPANATQPIAMSKLLEIRAAEKSLKAATTGTAQCNQYTVVRANSSTTELAGQIVGNGLQLTTAASVLSPVRLCVAITASLPVYSGFTIADFGYSAQSSSSPIVAQNIAVAVDPATGRMCGNVTQMGGTYFPVMRQAASFACTAYVTPTPVPLIRTNPVAPTAAADKSTAVKMGLIGLVGLLAIPVVICAVMFFLKQKKKREQGKANIPFQGIELQTTQSTYSRM